MNHASSAMEERVLTQPNLGAESESPLGLSHRSDVIVVLTWLSRLRWFALAGQLAAALIAGWWLDLSLPWAWLMLIISLTALTNMVLVVYLRRSNTLPAILVPGLLLLDVLLLTALLGATGGPHNPFCQLYVIHVAMAVVAGPARWTWGIVGAAVLCYGGLFRYSQPLVPSLAEDVYTAGSWAALTITAGVIAYFIGRLRVNLGERETQLATMRLRVEQGERLTSLASLAAGAAHELGTPLGTIAVVAHELERTAQNAEMSSAIVEDVRLIRSQVDRCRGIVDRMNIENVRYDRQTPDELPVEALMNDLREELKPGQFENLDWDVDPSVHVMEVHRTALVQVLAVLIQNAFDACEAEASRVTLSISPEGDYLRFTIRDRGVGMTSHQLRRAGEPFVTTKAPQRGLGLGLFLARSVTEHVKGTLTLRSAPGQGTVAVLKFPAKWH